MKYLTMNGDANISRLLKQSESTTKFGKKVLKLPNVWSYFHYQKNKEFVRQAVFKRDNYVEKVEKKSRFPKKTALFWSE